LACVFRGQISTEFSEKSPPRAWEGGSEAG
jgi:hypothetical protein